LVGVGVVDGVVETLEMVPLPVVRPEPVVVVVGTVVVGAVVVGAVAVVVGVVVSVPGVEVVVVVSVAGVDAPLGVDVPEVVGVEAGTDEPPATPDMPPRVKEPEKPV
jgi:hypothetical protein